MSLELTSRDLPGGVRWIVAKGVLDAATSDQLDALVSRSLAEGKSRIVCDLEAVSYIASAGVGVFVGSVGACRQKGGDLLIRYRDASEGEGQGLTQGFNPLEVFHLLGLGEVIRVVADEAEALAAFA